MKYITIILILFFAVDTNAQKTQGKARLDSLLSEVPKMGNDTPAVKLLVKIDYAYSVTSPDEGLRYAGKALELARRIQWKKGEAMAQNDFGNNYWHKGVYPAALDHFFIALHIYEDLRDTINIGEVAGNIGVLYLDQKNYLKAKEYLFKSLNAAQAVNNKSGKLITTGNIGNLYYDQGNYTEALDYMQKSLNIAIETGDKRGVINQETNIGTVYSLQNKNDLALDWYSKALATAEELGDDQVIATNQGNIGEVYFDIAMDTLHPLTPAKRSANLTKAASYLQKGIESCRKIHFTQALMMFSETLSKVYTQQGDYRGALAAYQQYTLLKDSTFNLANNEKIADLETKRAVALKDKDIEIAKLAVAKKRNERWFFIAGIAFLLAIMGILFKNFKKQQHSNVLLSKEKKRSDDLLLNILPEEVAAELKATGESKAKQYDEVSVLFTDFMNFTGASEKLSPQELVHELDECFTAFDAIIERNGLEKIKTIGDAYMAVCGMPVGTASHAHNAVQAALEISNFIRERRQSVANAFEIRIGINSGPVVAGIVGVKKFAYDIWGDTVNTAARMEQHGAPGAINISQSTYDLVKNDYHCDYRGQIEAKNKGLIAMYFVAGKAGE